MTPLSKSVEGETQVVGALAFEPFEIVSSLGIRISDFFPRRGNA